jgi:hypothetical protein
VACTWVDARPRNCQARFGGLFHAPPFRAGEINATQKTQKKAKLAKKLLRIWLLILRLLR